MRKETSESAGVCDGQWILCPIVLCTTWDGA